MKETLQTYGKAMLVPISLVAIGGLLLGLGGAFTSELTVTSLGIHWESYSKSFIFTIFTVIGGLGEVIFTNLGILYAIGVAFSLSKKEQGWAAFSALVAYLAMQITISILLKDKGLNAGNTSIDAFIAQGKTGIEAAKLAALYSTELGYFTYRTGVFGGIALGILISLLHRKFYNIKLPIALAFFSGTRTVPILGLFLGGTLGIFFFTFWPLIGSLLGNFSQFIHDSGLIGTFVYRFTVESLVPFGMHPLIELAIYWTELGGSMVVDGVIVTGNSAIQLAQLASPEPGKLLVRAFMGGTAIINFAIFPGIALAMYHTAKPQNKKKVAALLISTIISTTFFGITEPILFTFLFVAPWLYFFVYAPLAAIGEVLSELMQVSIYQGNIKDWIPFLLRPEKLNVWPFLFLFPIFFISAYGLFRFFVAKFNVLTPGREDEDDSNQVHPTKGENFVSGHKLGLSLSNTLAENIVAALGGKANIIELDNCISRLRVVLVDRNLIASEKIWKAQLGAMGLIRVGDNALQIIYGAQVAGIAVDVRDLLEDDNE